MVTIRCIAYNHEPYIRQCLEGFVIQKTNFRFEAIVHDDASTDDTAAIIREYAEKYPDIIKPIFETENQYSKQDGSLERIMNSHTCGKYVALCEGDDYWTDPYKLQKQVDFLEQNPEYGLVHTDCLICGDNKGMKVGRRGLIYGRNNDKNYSDSQSLFYNILINKIHIQTLTVLYRKSLLEKIKTNDITFKMGDTPLWLDISQCAKIKYLKDITGVYYKHTGSATRQKNINALLFRLSAFEMRIYYCYKYNYQIPLRIQKLYNASLTSVLLYCTDYKIKYDFFKYGKISSMYYGNILRKGFCLRFAKFKDKYIDPWYHIFEGKWDAIKLILKC